MATFTHGLNTAVLLGAYEVSPYFRSSSVDLPRDVAETTAFGSTSKSFIGGLVDATYTAEGMFDATGSSAIIESALAQSFVNVSFYPEGYTIGKQGFAMKASSTKETVSSSTDDVNMISFEAQSSTSGEYVVSLHALGAETPGTANAAGQLNAGGTTTQGAVGYIHVTAINGGTATVKVQHSPDNVTFADLITFTNVTAVGSERVATAGTVSVDPYLRARAILVGGTATFQVGAGRRPLTS